MGSQGRAWPRCCLGEWGRGRGGQLLVATQPRYCEETPSRSGKQISNKAEITLLFNLI